MFRIKNAMNYINNTPIGSLKKFVILTGKIIFFCNIHRNITQPHSIKKRDRGGGVGIHQASKKNNK